MNFVRNGAGDVVGVKVAEGLMLPVVAIHDSLTVDEPEPETEPADAEPAAEPEPETGGY